MKQRYGPQGCALLKTNTRPVSADSGEQIPDPWGQYLHAHHLSAKVNIQDKPRPLVLDPAGFSVFSCVWSLQQDAVRQEEVWLRSQPALRTLGRLSLVLVVCSCC